VDAAVVGVAVDAVALVVSDSAASVAAGSEPASLVSLLPPHEAMNSAAAMKMAARRIVVPDIGVCPL